MTRAHEPGHPLPGGGVRCVHCGAPMGTPYEYSCLDRRSGEKPPRARTPSAIDDNDAISTRLAELQKEREAALNAPPEVAAVVAADGEFDWMCG